MKGKKDDRFLLDSRKDEFKKCFDREWLKEVAKKENKTETEVWEEIKKGIKGITYDLRLGEEAFTSSCKTPINLKEKGYVEIESGETALLMTYERINMPENHMGFLSLRTTYASKGLINISGFHIDPGFKGKLVFSLYNSSPRPVVLKYKDPIYHMFLIRLSGKVTGEHRPSFQGMETLRSDWIEAIKGPPVTLHGLHQEFYRLRTRTNLLITILGGLLVTLLGYLILTILKVI